MAEETNVMQKAYDMVVYLVPVLEKYPRTHKFLIADRIANKAIDTLELLTMAYYSQREKKIPILERANLNLEQMRLLIRLSHDFRCISTDRYEVISKKINEVGSIVGGWLKSLK